MKKAIGVALLVVWGSCGCCTQHLAYFRAAPLRYCPSTKSIAVSWFSDGRTVHVTATPPVPELAESRQDARRSLTIAPRATSIQLDFGAGDNRPVQQIAPLGRDDSALARGGSVAGCIAGAAVVPFDIDPAQYAPEVVVTALQNPLDVAITVEHAGASWTIDPGARVSLAPAAGAERDDPPRHIEHTWTLRAPVPGGCNDTAARPSKLGVLMTLECSP